MEHTLVLEVSDTLYQSLTTAAQRIGASPEKVAIQWLAVLSQQITDDPLEQFIGAFNGQGLAWGDQHDLYLGQNLLAESTEQYDASKIDA